jgi:DNA-binding CsgD family transcriptional regulator
VKDAATRVRCPTHVFHPKDDQMVRFEQGRRLATLIPGARFVPLEGSNHIPFPSEPAWQEFVREVHAFLGDTAAARGVAHEPAPHLTPRQSEILRRIATGQTDKQIAVALSLSPRTVEMHAAGALKALGCKTRAEAVACAARARLLDA